MLAVLGWIFTLLATCFAAVDYFVNMNSAQSAPQQAAAAAAACATVIIPYVFTRAIEGITRPWRVKSRAPEPTKETADAQSK